LRFGIPQGLPFGELDDTVAAQFNAAIVRLARAGVHLFDAAFSLFDEMGRVQSAATIATVEAWHIHRERIAAHGADYDQIVRARIETGSRVSDADYANMLKDRSELVSAMDLALAEFDALVLPTTPIVAPTMAEISTEKEFSRANRLLLRNTAIANFFDLCAISLPMPGTALPTGLMLFARRGQDRRLFNLGASVERLLS
jgi:aspartyl-tRNA(Asn)/glutamyl-tRNA(Gln) amidotransferase subunit A